MSIEQTLQRIDDTLDDYDQWSGHSPDAARWAGEPTEGEWPEPIGSSAWFGRCEITGDATIERRDDGEMRWLHTDPQIHVLIDLLDQIDHDGMAFLDSAYEIGECCPYDPSVKHARRRL